MGQSIVHWVYRWSTDNFFDADNGTLQEWFYLKTMILSAHLIGFFRRVFNGQCSIFIRHDNGRLGHEEGVGKYDDDVIGAGLTEQASLFMGEGPKFIKPPVTGWKGRELAKREKAGVWGRA